MRVIARSLLVVFVAVLGSVGVAVAWTTTTAIQLLATTALIMGGTDHPLIGPKDPPSFVTDYLDNAVNLYIDPSAAAGTGTAGPVTNAVAVSYPAEFFPVFGSRTFDSSVSIGRANLHNCIAGNNECDFNADPLVDPEVGSVYPPDPLDDIAAFGYSQSAVVASLVKRDLIEDYQEGHTASFILDANPMRPNGGILTLLSMLPPIPLVGITFHGAAPTNSPVVDDNGTPDDPTDDTYAYPTADYAQQYDALGGDFPFRPLNLLATLNALAGYALLHSNVVNKPASEALFQGERGDTTYYMFPTELVPVLMPLQIIVPKPILSALDAMVRPVIEDAYRRDVNPGVPMQASILPIGNPITLALKLVAAVPVAIDNALQDLGVGRPLGTTRPGLFGVGGPSLPEPPTEEAVDDSAESVAPEDQSLVAEMTEEPAADTEPVAAVDEESEPVEPETATEEVEPETTEEVTEEVEPETATEELEPKTATDEVAEEVEPETATEEVEPETTEEVTEEVEPETSTEEQAETSTEEQAETTTPKPDKTPAATDPDRPEVRGPIKFDSSEPQPDSPSKDQDDDQDDAGNSETASDPSPTGADDKKADKDDKKADKDDQSDQDAAA